MLQALSRVFNVQVLIVSVLGPQHNTLVSNTGIYSADIPTLTLGYYPEEHGEHYYSVEVAPAELNRFLETFRRRPKVNNALNVQATVTEETPAPSPNGRENHSTSSQLETDTTGQGDEAKSQ